MNWLKYAAPIVQVILATLRILIGYKQKRLGQLEAENAQSTRDLDHLRKASGARRAVRNDPERVRSDPRNRDAR